MRQRRRLQTTARSLLAARWPGKRALPLPPAAFEGDRAKPELTGAAETLEAIDHERVVIVILGET
jgi:hypothetical protein